jgi:hypothetical protein
VDISGRIRAARLLALLIDNIDQSPRTNELFGEINLRPNFACKLRCQNEGQGERVQSDPVHLVHLP